MYMIQTNMDNHEKPWSTLYRRCLLRFNLLISLIVVEFLGYGGVLGNIRNLIQRRAL